MIHGHPMSGNGWAQIRAGVSLIHWSGIAHWDQNGTTLVPAASDDFELGAARRHTEFGRLICWLIFSAGSEYVLKGACLLKGLNINKQKRVLRPPSMGNLAVWAKAVAANDPSVYEDVNSLGTLGDLPLRTLLKDLPAENELWASVELLRQTVRNRDAHQYVQNVRASHFHLVPTLFVPALNAVLASLDKNQLRSHLSGLAHVGSSR